MEFPWLIKQRINRQCNSSSKRSICKALDCQPGEIIEYVADDEDETPSE